MKSMKMIVAAAALALAPGLAMAMCGHDRQQSTSSCGEGFVYDATSGTCVKAATS